MGFDYIGKSFERVDGYAKVTGGAKFVADLKLPRMLHAQVLRPPRAHARILSINTSAALESGGSTVSSPARGARYGSGHAASWTRAHWPSTA